MILRFYNRLCTHNSPLVREVLKADTQAGASSRLFWSSHLLRALENVDDSIGSRKLQEGVNVDINNSLRKAQIFVIRSWLHNTSDFRSTRSVSPFYQEIVAGKPLRVGKTNLFRLPGAPYVSRYLSKHRHALLACFRLRCAPLQFLLSVREGISSVLCKWCSRGIQDEFHVFLECQSPQLCELRVRFAPLFQVHDLRSFYQQCPLRLSDLFKELFALLCASGQMSG